MKKRPNNKRRHYPPPAMGVRPTQLISGQNHWVGRFSAMACDCEILVDTEDRRLAKKMLKLAAGEAWRIERKFSRYRPGNIIDQINGGKAAAVQLDEETAQLIDFSEQCYKLSDGKFDITSGILRRVWTFNRSDKIPRKEDVDGLLFLIGWDKVSWHSPEITLPTGMQIDLGGLGKEYAVDRILRLLQERFEVAALVNLGGDIAVGGDRRDGLPWSIGIESNPLSSEKAPVIQVLQGALATSGDSKRFLLKDGRRYSHILNPLSGWPAKNAPHSVTVAAGSCTEAGLFATLAMLQGEKAEAFLDKEEVRYWCVRG